MVSKNYSLIFITNLAFYWSVRINFGAQFKFVILFEIDWFALTTFATKFEVHLALRYNDRAKLLKIKEQRKGIRENIDQA